MRILSRLVLLGFLALPVLWADPKMCVREAPIPESYTWNFPAEAVERFDELRAGSREVMDRAAKLDAFTRHPRLMGWESHAIELDQVRFHINDMGETLCRLQTIRHVLEPWQQKAVDRITPRLAALADQTEAAIEYLRENQTYLADPAYADYFDQIYEGSRDLREATTRYVDYAETTSEVERLERTPQIEGLLPGS